MAQTEDIGDVIAAQLMKYQGWIMAFLAVILFGSGGYFVVEWMGNHKEVMAREDIAGAEEVLFKKREEFAKKQNPPPAIDKSKKVVTPPPTPVADFDREYKSSVEAVQRAILTHLDTKAALASSLELSEFLIDQKRPQMGIETLEKSLSAAKPTDLLFALGKFQLANLYGMANQYDRAQQYYLEVLKAPAAQFMAGEILLRLGLCSQKLGQLAQAKDYFNRVVLEYSETEAATSAKTYLRLLRLQPATTQGS